MLVTGSLSRSGLWGERMRGNEQNQWRWSQRGRGSNGWGCSYFLVTYLELHCYLSRKSDLREEPDIFPGINDWYGSPTPWQRTRGIPLSPGAGNKGQRRLPGAGQWRWWWPIEPFSGKQLPIFSSFPQPLFLWHIFGCCYIYMSGLLRCSCGWLSSGIRSSAAENLLCPEKKSRRVSLVTGPLEGSDKQISQPKHNF